MAMMTGDGDGETTGVLTAATGGNDKIIRQDTKMCNGCSNERLASSARSTVREFKHRHLLPKMPALAGVSGVYRVYPIGSKSSKFPKFLRIAGVSRLTSKFRRSAAAGELQGLRHEERERGEYVHA
jgi:hypothetical protein